MKNILAPAAPVRVEVPAPAGAPASPVCPRVRVGVLDPDPASVKILPVDVLDGVFRVALVVNLHEPVLTLKRHQSDSDVLTRCLWLHHSP